MTTVIATAVVSEEAEQSLRSLGHEVQRIGGDRVSILDTLEDLGSRRVLRGGRPAADAQAPERPSGKASAIMSASGAPAARDAVLAEKKTRGKARAK